MTEQTDPLCTAHDMLQSLLVNNSDDKDVLCVCKRIDGTLWVVYFRQSVVTDDQQVR